MAGIDIISNTTGEKIAEELSKLVTKTVGASVTTEEVSGGTKVTIVAGEETASFIVKNGTDGVDGNDGKDGQNGSDGMDEESAEEFYSSYVENNSQVMGTLAIVKNGERNTYNGVSDVEISIESGEQLTANEKTLTSGTLASGMSAWSSAEIDLTLGDLKKYKTFVVRVNSTISTTLMLEFGCHKVPLLNNGDSTPKFMAVCTWLDTAKTILDVTILKGCDSGSVINDYPGCQGAFMPSYQCYKSLRFTNANSSQNGAYKATETSKLKFTVNKELTADITYEVIGVIEYA